MFSDICAYLTLISQLVHILSLFLRTGHPDTVVSGLFSFSRKASIASDAFFVAHLQEKRTCLCPRFFTRILA